MPNKKKKYNARFPPARIKKIMQMDEDVGKVAAPVPVIISRALELFMESLLSKTHTYTQDRNAKTLSAAHIKQVIQAEPSYDFLRDLVANIPDVQPEEEGSIVGSGGVATLRRSSSVQGREGGGKDSKGGRGRGKRGRPRKQPQHTDGARSEEDEEGSDNSMDGDSGHDGYAGHDDAISTAFHHQQQQPHLSSSTTNAADLLSLGMQSAGIPSAQDEGHETQQQSIAALAHPQPSIAHTTHPTDVYESSKLPSDVHATHTSDMHKLATSLSSEHNHGMQMPTNRIVAMDNPILHSKATIPLPVKKEQATVQSSTGVMSEGDPHIPTSSISQPLKYPDDSNAADMRATSSATPIPFSGSTCTQPTSLPDNHMLQVMHGTLPQQPLPVHTAKPHHTLAKEQTSTMVSTADTNESHSEQHATSSHYSAPVLEGTSQHNAPKPFSSLLPHDHKEHHMLSTSSSGHLPPQHPQIKMEASPTAENLSIAKIPGSNGMYSTVAAHSPSPPAAHLSAASGRYHASPHVVSGIQPPARPPPGAFIRSPVPPYYHISSSSPTAQHPSSIANNHPPTHIDNLASSATGPRMLAGESMSALHHHHRHPYSPLMSPHDDRDQPLQLTTTQPHVAHQPPHHHHDTHSEPLQLTTNHRSKPTDAQYFDNCQPEDLSKPQQR